MIKKTEAGLSLLEILVVVSIFAVLGILITRSVLSTLGGGKKSESLIRVRENLNYSMGVIERQLRNANAITDCSNTNTAAINYLDQEGATTSFSCVNVGAAGKVGYVASESAKLTNDTVNVTGCSFTCKLGTAGTPSSVKINLQGSDASATGVENAVVTTSTEVFLRNY
jgi:type II secretory pathway component PulJ